MTLEKDIQQRIEVMEKSIAVQLSRLEEQYASLIQNLKEQTAQRCVAMTEIRKLNNRIINLLRLVAVLSFSLVVTTGGCLILSWLHFK